MKNRTTRFRFNELNDRLERLSTPRLALRPVALADAWPLYQATRNPQFNRHLMWDRPDDEAQVLRRVDAIVEASRRGEMAAVSAVVRETGEWVSLYRFQPYGDDRQALEMGLWTHDRFWRGGYSLELTRACVDAAFEISDAERLIAAAAPENEGSCRVLDSGGLQPAELVLRSTESGRRVPLREYALARSTWAARSGGVRHYNEFPFAHEPAGATLPQATGPVKEVELA
jgi:RimJ/RimL family protein N-acetyltransferase